MIDSSEDRAAVLIPPPLIFFVILGAGLVFQFLFPFITLHGFWVARLIIGGFLMVVAGLLAVSAILLMRKRKTPFDPSKPTMHIIKEGAFRFSRNPLYLALVLLQSGIAIVFFSLWLSVGAPILFILLQFLAVRPEETYLTQKFGQEYLDYKASVRRWI